MTVSTDASPPNAAAPSRRARGRLVTAAIASLSMVVAGEVLLRGCVGLGDPPLYARHPTIEYILRPGSYRPFGNDFHVNAASMRSPDSATGPLSAGERRVLVLGDSIVCGGNSVPDGALATTLLAESLGGGDGASRVSICNVSAGSWGPRNLLAYLEEHGTFGAEVAIVVLNSADWTDVPTFEDLGPDRPERRPALALVELCTRYLPRLIPFGAGERAPADIGESVTAEADIEALVGLLRARGLRVAVVLHPAASEL
ncbi:MAG: hypothetical protein RIS86_1772, partial [Planctomycetota bacterium]